MRTGGNNKGNTKEKIVQQTTNKGNPANKEQTRVTMDDFNINRDEWARHRSKQNGSCIFAEAS
jgi:hypothetical protein